MVVSTARLVCELWTPVPWADIFVEWSWLNEHGLNFADLFRPHNEHIIFVPRLFYLADRFFCAGSTKLLLVCNFVLAMAIALLFYRVAARRFFTRRLDAWLYFSVVLTAYVNANQLNNLVAGFMIQHWLDALGCLMFAYCFAGLCEQIGLRKRIFLHLGLLVFATAVTLTAGNGVACLLVAFLLSAVFRLGWKRGAYFAILFAVVAAAYLHFNPAARSNSLESIAKSPGDAVRFYLAFLGGPYSRCEAWYPATRFWFFDGRVVTRLGLVIFAAGIIVVWRAWLQRERRDFFSLFHVFVIVLVFGTGVLTTVARLPLGVYYGTDTKYAATVLLAWISIFSLVIKQASCYGSLCLPHRRLAWLGGYLVVLFAVLPGHFREAQIFREWNGILWRFESAMVAKIYDPLFISASFPDKALAAVRDYMRPRKLGIFSRYRFEIGEPLAAYFKVVDSSQCLGAFDTRTAMASQPPGVWMVEGWAWDKKHHGAFRDIILADASGAIVGVAHTNLDRRDPAEAYPGRVELMSGWVGYARSLDPHSPISAYGVLDAEGNVCLIGKR